MSSREAPVEIVPYDPSWPGLFDEEKRALLETLSAWLAGPIEHIGSTAVPGLAAKPVIDIMAGVATLNASRPALPALADLGYCYAPYRADARTISTSSPSAAQSGSGRSRFATICARIPRSRPNTGV